MTAPVVVTVGLAATYDLRRRVLRDGTPSDQVHFDEDTWPGTFHLGIHGDGGTPIAIATFCPRPTPWREGRRAVQLRGMAVDAQHQRRGLGRALLATAVPLLAKEGVQVLWANARDSALPFYERLGMRPVGDGFVATDTRLLHHTVLLDLA